MARWRTILFDLDDTLYPERAFVLSGFRAAAQWAEAALNIPATVGVRQLETYFNAGVRGDTFDRWLSQHGLASGGWIADIIRAYREHAPDIAPYPDVVPLLARLRGRVRLGLITDGYADVQRRKLAALDLLDYFDVVIFSDDLGREAWKPSPLPFTTALARTGTEPRAAVYVADNPAKDFIGARRLGMSTVRVRRPDGLHRLLEPATPEHGADVDIDDLPSLEPLMAGEVTVPASIGTPR